jgi:hypothetical protein
VISRNSFKKLFYDLSSAPLYRDVGFFTDITNALLIDGANAVSIAAQRSLGKIEPLLYLHWFSTPAAIKTLLRYLSVTFRAKNERQYSITIRTLHLFLLGIKVLNEPFDIPFIPPQFIEKFLGLFVGKESI